MGSPTVSAIVATTRYAITVSPSGVNQYSLPRHVVMYDNDEPPYRRIRSRACAASFSDEEGHARHEAISKPASTISHNTTPVYSNSSVPANPSALNRRGTAPR